MKATVLEDVMAVLRRLMKAVFFFKDESSELLVENTSTQVSVQETGMIADRWLLLSPAQTRALVSRKSPILIVD